MSRQNIYSNINLDEIAGRLKSVLNLNSDRQLSDLFGISPQDYSMRKKKGTVIYLMIDVALNRKINLQWLFYGEGDTSPQPPSDGTTDEFNIYDLLKKTGEILESPTIFRTALASNINAFHQSIRMSEAISALETRLVALEEKDRSRIGRDAPAEDMADVLRRVTDLERKCKELESENNALKSSGPVDPSVTELPITTPPTRSTGRKNT